MISEIEEMQAYELSEVQPKDDGTNSRTEELKWCRERQSITT